MPGPLGPCVVSLVVALLVVGSASGVPLSGDGWSPGWSPASDSPGWGAGDTVTGPTDSADAVAGDNFTRPAPDHGVDPAIFPRLWSGDVDSGSGTETGSAAAALLSVTDYPFARPPVAVETWTQGELGDFPQTDANRSVFPSHATRRDARWIRDAYIQVFAALPSTVTHVARGDTRQYIRPSGRVLATTDYRVELPPDEQTAHDPAPPVPGETVLLQTVVTWEVVDHRMGNITLAADGTPEATVAPSHTPQLAYAGLPQSTETLTVSVTVSATLRQNTRRKFGRATNTCATPTPTGDPELPNPSECEVTYETFWLTNSTDLKELVTVQDSLAVAVYDLSPTVTRATFLNRGAALAVDQREGDPWVSARLPGGVTVQNLWHFYAARDPRWDSLITSAETGTTEEPSGSIPLQVHAFPSAGGAYSRPTLNDIEVTRTWGPERLAPILPPHITLSVVEGSYAMGSVVVVRGAETLATEGPLTIRGLVRGSSVRVPATETRRLRPATMNLELLEVNRSAGTARVRLSIRDGETRRPIDLRSRPGTLEVQGLAVQPDAAGTAVVTVPLGGNVITARYSPGPWWATDPAYASARASVTLPTRWPDPLQIVLAGFALLAWLAPLLLAIFLIDRLFGRGWLWPPWRGIR